MYKTQVRFGGILGERLKANLDNWLLIAPLANPAMSDMFLRHDREPRNRLVPWYGEFPGKYITSAAAAYACESDSRLEKVVENLIERLSSAQEDSGLLSPHPRSEWLKGESAWEGDRLMVPLWELWGYYHLMIGLLDWYHQTGSPAAYRLLRTSADAVSDAFLSGSVKLEEARAPENLGLAHGYALLYQASDKAKDLEMMQLILRHAESQRHYVEGAIEGKQFHELPWPRWEALHVLQALGESKDAEAQKAMLHLADGIRYTDRHNTGGFSSGERGCGDPYDPGAIETCCVVAWMALLGSCYQLSGDTKWIDELELALFNAALGAQHPTGRWWTYSTPMDGVRFANAHTLAFQSMQGSPELNCCSVNGPRILGMTAQWGLRVRGDAIEMNYYGSSRWQAALPDGNYVHITQSTNYPSASHVELIVSPARRVRFKLRLRIPAWSQNTRVVLCGKAFTPQSGNYFDIEKEWTPGEKIDVFFDFSMHTWRGKKACEGKYALYYGPLLLAFDQRFNAQEPGTMPAVHADSLEKIAYTGAPDWFPPQILLKDKASGAVLCDFATAGATGSHYASWLYLQGGCRRSFFSVD